MAEVRGKLRSGVHRLSALTNGHSRSVCTGDTGRHESVHDQREVRMSTATRATQPRSAKVSTVRRSRTGREDGSLQGFSPLELHSGRFNGLVETKQARRTVFYLSERLQPGLQEELLPGSRGAAAFHPDAFRSSQQLRAFCTVVLILAERGPGSPGFGRRRLKLHHHPSAHRNYSWRSDSSSTDAPLLHRSRTAYYDVLRVSPGATQAQIKTAYYTQSFIYHPDKNPGSEEATQRFSEISEAYTVLGNISLRKKYDRGILSQSDVQIAGRPSSRETPSRPRGSPQQQQAARPFSQAGRRPLFDFDAFYQAHYGEQLQREREMRARKERMQQGHKKNVGWWREGKMKDVTVAMLLALAGVFYISICKS